jgi:hypothetical protein
MDKQAIQQDNICHLKHLTTQDMKSFWHICKQCDKKFQMEKYYICPTCGVKQKYLRHLDLEDDDENGQEGITDWCQCEHCNATATENSFTVTWDFIYE